MTPRRRVLTLIAAASIAACSANPPRHAAVEDARIAVNRAEADARVTQLAPAELQRARDLLARADAQWTKEREEESAAHLAYLARQQAAIAEARARQRAADAQIADANSERDRVRLQARTREAEQARQRAQSAQEQAHAARSSFEQAEQAAQAAQREAQAAQQEAATAREAAATERDKARAEAERTAHVQQQLADLAAKPTPRGIVVTLQDVVFDVGKAELKPGAERYIERLAAVLSENPDRRVLIEGFTDSQGGEEYNRTLSERRAGAVRQALVDKGVAPHRIEMRGYGESFPIASNDSATGRQLNRRVEVVISDAQGRLAGR